MKTNRDVTRGAVVCRRPALGGHKVCNVRRKTGNALDIWRRCVLFGALPGVWHPAGD
jgi:hypothetical protein